jgi:membrane-bound ClpP family serine protease
MTLVVLLLAAGLLLLAAEIVVPGAVLGIIGGLFLLAGVIVAFQTLEEGRAYVVLLISVVAGLVVLILEFTVLPRTRVVKSLSMTQTVTGRAQAIDVATASAYVGREAVAQTKLAPSGYILVDGRQLEAFSRDGVVESGTRLRVVGVDNFRLIVSKLTS